MSLLTEATMVSLLVAHNARCALHLCNGQPSSIDLMDDLENATPFELT